jgi:competence protein ComEC
MRGKMQRKMHESWLVAWFSASLIGGIGAAFWVHSAEFSGVEFVAVSLAFLIIAIARRTVAFVLLAIMAGLLLGLWRGENVRLATAGYQKFIGQSVRLEGTVTDDVTHKNGETGMKLDKVRVDNQPLGGEVWAGTISNISLKRDDAVVITGKLRPGFGTFAASTSYAALTKVARPAHGDIIREARDNFAAGLRKAVPEPEATLGLGYLTGQHNDLPDTLIKQLQLVGLIHLVIAGGYNVTILVRFARRQFSKLSKYLAMLSAGMILFGLTLMAGFTAPMARTFVVTGLSLGVWYYGRKIHPLVLLPFAAAITAIITPTFVWGDVGWYMTFIAYGGLIMLAPMLKRIFWHDKDTGVIKQIIVDTISVQIVTMPLMAFAFQQYSIYGLPANLIVLPFMPLTMLAVAIAGLCGMMLPAPLAHIFGWPATQLLSYTDRVTTWLATAPGVDATASFNWSELLVTYAVLLALIYFLWRKTHYNFREENLVE